MLWYRVFHSSTVTSLCNDCFGSQENSPYIELSSLRGATAARMQLLLTICIVLTCPYFKWPYTEKSLYHGRSISCFGEVVDTASFKSNNSQKLFIRTCANALGSKCGEAGTGLLRTTDFASCKLLKECISLLRGWVIFFLTTECARGIFQLEQQGDAPFALHGAGWWWEYWLITPEVAGSNPAVLNLWLGSILSWNLIRLSTVSSLYKDTRCKDHFDARARQLTTKHCILIALVSLSKDNMI